MRIPLPLPVYILLSGFLLPACQPQDNRPAGSDGWLKGDQDEKFNTVAGQLRGFDMAMVETGYRYAELYWAGQDQNWEYADYQVDKIRTAIENGLERRPKRSESAQPFLQTDLPAMKAAIQAQDTVLFRKNFVLLQASCRSCHVKEDVPFIQAVIPQVRVSSIQLKKND
jgi:hypothetical protein